MATGAGLVAFGWRIWRRVGSPILVGLTVCTLMFAASVLASRSERGLTIEPQAWKGEAQILTDPRQQTGQVKLTLRIEGKHLLASVPSQRAQALGKAQVGQWIWVEGSIRSLKPPVPAWMKARHLAGRITVRSVGAETRTPLFFRIVNSIRNSLLRSGSVLPRTQQPLFGGFLLGDDRGQSPEIADDFQGSGLGHLLVVSGQNVAFTLAAVDPALRRVSRLWRLVATFVVLFLFAAVTRFEPSVLRASVMAAIAVWAKHAGRPQSGVRVLALTVLVLVLIDPMLVKSVGFLLSASASLGILLWVEPIAIRLPGPRWLSVPLATSLAAQAATSPIILLVFGGIPTVTFLANLLALPAAEPVMAWGVLAGLPAGVLGRTVSRIVHLPTQVALAWVSVVARICSGLPLGEITWPIMAIACTLSGMVWLIAKRNRSVGKRVRYRGIGEKGATVGFLLLLAIIAVLSGIVQPPFEGGRLANGVHAWCEHHVGVSRHCQVVVVEHGANPANTLLELRRRRIRAIDLLVVRNGGIPQATMVRAIGDRVHLGGVAAGERRFSGGFQPTIVAAAGTRLLAPPFRIHFPSVDSGRLTVVVERIRPAASGRTVASGR